MSEPLPETISCPSCRAANLYLQLQCDRCGQPLHGSGVDSSTLEKWRSERVPIGEVIEQRSNTESRDSLAILGSFTVVFAILVSLVTLQPGWAVAVLLLSIPPFLRTVLMTRRRLILNRPTTEWQRIISFACSLGVVVSMCLVVMLAAAATFPYYCFVYVGSGGKAPVHLIYIPLVMTVLIVLLGFVPGIRRRWRNDTQDW